MNAGPGRPKGSKNKRTILLGERLERAIPDEKLIAQLWKLAQKGDSRCLLYICDRRWGKMAQPIGGDAGNPVTVRILSDDRLGVKA